MYILYFYMEVFVMLHSCKSAELSIEIELRISFMHVWLNLSLKENETKDAFLQIRDATISYLKIFFFWMILHCETFFSQFFKSKLIL